MFESDNGAAESLLEAGDLEASIALCRKHLADEPKDAEAHNRLGMLLADRGNFNEAATCFRTAVELYPDHRCYELHLALSLIQLRGFDEREIQLPLIRQHESMPPLQSWTRRFAASVATSLESSGDYTAALAVYQTIAAIEPQNKNVLIGAASLMLRVGEYEASAAWFDRAEALDPSDATLLLRKSEAFQELGRFDEAIAVCERALLLDPVDPAVLRGFGQALAASGQFSDALKVFKRGIEARPEDPEDWIRYSMALQDAGMIEQSERAAREALRLAPLALPALSRLGGALLAAGEAEEALAMFRVASQCEGAGPEAWSELALALHYADEVSSREIAEVARHFARELGSTNCERREPKGRSVKRIGFLVSDLRPQASARFLLAPLKHRPRDGVKVYLYCSSLSKGHLKDALQQSCDVWRSVAGRSDEEAAAMIRRDEVDLLIDLEGHRPGGRLALLARRPAPFQATWLGPPGPTGLAAVDFRISDAAAFEAVEAALYHERPILIEEGFHSICWDGALAPNSSPALEGAGFTFASCNDLAKLSPRSIRAWAKILLRAPHARLLLSAWQLADSGLQRRLESKFEAVGVSSERIKFSESPPDDASRLRLYHEVDLCLDPFPCNGAVASCEALYMGVPFLTLLGKRERGRVGASLLTQVGLDAFICESEEEYIDAAVSWSRKPLELDVIRNRLRLEFERSSLGNGHRFAAGFFPALAQACLEGPSEPSRAGRNLGSEVRDESRRGPDMAAIGRFLPDSLIGLRVLDACCLGDDWSTEVLRRGASSVVCFPAEGGSFTPKKSDSMAACLAEVRVGEAGQFDWILLAGQVNRIRHPQLVFDKARALCRGRLLISLEVSPAPSGAGTMERAVVLEPGLIWRPTSEALRLMLAEAGFEIEAWNVTSDEGGQVVVVARAVTTVIGGGE